MSKKFQYSTLWNWNGHLLCAVDLKTTGNIPGFDDVLEVGILPLDSEIRFAKGLLPFAPILQPKRPENYFHTLSFEKRVRISECKLNGLEAYTAADLLDEWFKNLGLAERKTIIPLSYNWPQKRAFMVDWLGEKNFAGIFDYRYRDILGTTAFLNDRSEFQLEQQIPYPKLDLSYLCSQSKIERAAKNDALADCVAIAEVYRLAIKGSL